MDCARYNYYYYYDYYYYFFFCFWKPQIYTALQLSIFHLPSCHDCKFHLEQVHKIVAVEHYSLLNQSPGAGHLDYFTFLLSLEAHAPGTLWPWGAVNFRFPQGPPASGPLHRLFLLSCSLLDLLDVLLSLSSVCIDTCLGFFSL